ncbi:unnamed protein product [Ectocarpus sp. 12 AP-2014]
MSSYISRSLSTSSCSKRLLHATPVSPICFACLRIYRSLCNVRSDNSTNPNRSRRTNTRHGALPTTIYKQITQRRPKTAVTRNSSKTMTPNNARRGGVS